ncbi:MAG: RnfABCDGE type electron transport complex subunit G [bacterium]|nr:RnfABCDGE type electron transport complex subunit G [bacterium]MDT8396198.1 RnfABCDGE type electron transport complex subunit G [bacterium]
MTSTARLILVLAGICCVAGLCLAGVYEITKEPIAYQKKLDIIRSLEAVLPGLEMDPDTFFLDMTREDGTNVRVYRARGEDGQVVGAAFQVVAPDGYSGGIFIMMGLTPDARLGGIEILSHAETPGLGALIEKEEWKGIFRGLSLETANFKVKKDGGDIDQITGATISPRAVAGAVEKGLKWYLGNRDKILDPSGESS